MGYQIYHPTLYPLSSLLKHIQENMRINPPSPPLLLILSLLTQLILGRGI